MNSDIRVGDHVQFVIDNSALTRGVVKTAYVEEREEGRIPRGYLISTRIDGVAVDTYCEAHEVSKI